MKRPLIARFSNDYVGVWRSGLAGVDAGTAVAEPVLRPLASLMTH
jgi:hypothetical protein